MVIFTNLELLAIYDYCWNKDICAGIIPMDIGTYNPNRIKSLSGIIPTPNDIPYEVLSDYDSEQFDYAYINYLTNGPGFLPMVYIATKEYYYGDYLHVYVINKGGFKDATIELFMKVLYERYGIESYIVSQLDDLDYVVSSWLSINGLTTIGNDITIAMSINPDIFKDL